MGVEVLAGVFAWLVFLVGFFASVVLFGLSLTGSSRPYALSVLTAAVVFAAFLTFREARPSGQPWSSLWFWYALGVVIFGAIAYALNRIVKWRNRSAS
jgi:hypothetical protein